MNATQPPPIPQAPAQSGMRHLVWIIPLGCLGGLAALAGFIAIILVFVFGLMKSSDVYKEALAIAQEDSRVQAALGTPIEPGFLVSGNIHTSGASGEADLAIPISGPNGRATLYVDAAKAQGEWTYQTLAVRIEQTGETISLLDERMQPPLGGHS